MVDYEHLLVKQDGDTVRITMNRPERRNALSEDHLRELLDAFETAGRSTRLKLRTFRDPVWARQVDFQDDLIVDLTVDGDAVLVDLTPHELVKVDVTLQSSDEPA